jgi:predicted  nucleic acid-binding Zn-ribbon protein
MSEITTRCIVCDAEFTDEQVKGASGCPKCGTTSLPLSPERDRTIKINEHELRILTMWASNWADAHCEPSSQKTLAAILQRLRAQLPEVLLTMADEVRQLQDAGYKASLVMSDGKVVVPEKGDPS